MKDTKIPSTRPTLRGWVLALAVASGFLAATGTSRAQTQVFSENFDADNTANWTFNAGPGTDSANFFFDYGTLGIPSAPNSTGGTTRGLKMQANVSGSIFSGSSVSPNGFSVAGDYELSFDMWLNYNGPLNGGGNGSTMLTGAGIGTAGNVAVWQGGGDGVWFMTSGDGGTSIDYRAYTPGAALAAEASGVYAAGTGTGVRNNTDPYYNTFGGAAAPAAQLTAYPQQTGATATGSQGFRWRDVRIRKLGNTVTWSIDGKLLATVDASALTLGGGNILFNQADINSASSTDVNAPVLAFGLIDNIRVTNFSTVVSVSATTAAAAEAGPTAGTFTFTRTASGTPLTVNFTLTGTAVNGVDYKNAGGVAVPTSVTFAASDLTTNVAIIPVDDTLAELTETVVLSLVGGPGYGLGSPASDTVYIADNETPTIDLAPLYSTMYERLTNDYASFRLTRRGDTNAASFNVNFSASGSAGAYQPVGTLTFDPGLITSNLHVHPFDNSTLDGPRSVTIQIASGGGYVIGTNDPVTAAIVDDETPPETVVWSDNLQTDTSGNWTLLFGSATPDILDFTTNWMYDYSAAGIPPAPHSGTDTHGLKIDINAAGVAAGLNLYPSGQSFSGNYALRFDMYLAVGSSGLFTTELALFGLNHDGLHTNWFKNSGVPAGWTFDGLWCWIEADGAEQYTGGDYRLSGAATGTEPSLLAGRLASSLVDVFKAPPWADYMSPSPTYGYAGVPANIMGTSPNPSTTTPSWADVELSQIGNVVRLTIDRTPILSYTNTSGPVSGKIMLGFCDPANSIGATETSVIYANARVISLAAPLITNTVRNGGNAEITFTANAGDVVGQFVLQQSTPSVTGPYSDTTSTITPLGGGTFKAVKAAGADSTFYRIRRIY
jgi:hypothetical protein